MANKTENKISKFNPENYLEKVGRLDDRDIDLGLAALALCVPSHAGISVDRYIHHLEKLISEVADRFAALLKEGADEVVETQLAALKHVLSDQYEYQGDVERYDDLQNASLISVIDRAKGLPITLCVLCIYAARGQGWDIAGLNIPGHFLCRIERDGQRLMFDPFDGCQIVEAQDLRIIVKRSLGEEAELSSEYYEAASNRDILMRLQNNIKFRQIEVEDYSGGLETVKLMQKIDPDEYRLLLDAGVLYARTDQPSAAIDSLVGYIEKAPNSRDRMEAELLLQQLNDQLN